MSDLFAMAREMEADASAGTTRKLSYGARMNAKKKEAANLIKNVLEREGLLETLNEEERAAIDLLTHTRAPKERTARATTFTKMFGENPNAGDTVTAADMFLRTGKGFAEMRNLIKKWASLGTVVAFDENAKVFTLTAINNSAN